MNRYNYRKIPAILPIKKNPRLMSPHYPPDSDFEIAVMESLQREGFECVPQVGAAGYFIDVGSRIRANLVII